MQFRPRRSDFGSSDEGGHIEYRDALRAWQARQEANQAASAATDQYEADVADFKDTQATEIEQGIASLPEISTLSNVPAVPLGINSIPTSKAQQIQNRIDMLTKGTRGPNAEEQAMADQLQAELDAMGQPSPLTTPPVVGRPTELPPVMQPSPISARPKRSDYGAEEGMDYRDDLNAYSSVMEPPPVASTPSVMEPPPANPYTEAWPDTTMDQSYAPAPVATPLPFTSLGGQTKGNYLGGTVSDFVAPSTPPPPTQPPPDDIIIDDPYDGPINYYTGRPVKNPYTPYSTASGATPLTRNITPGQFGQPPMGEITPIQGSQVSDFNDVLNQGISMLPMNGQGDTLTTQVFQSGFRPRR